MLKKVNRIAVIVMFAVMLFTAFALSACGNESKDDSENDFTGEIDSSLNETNGDESEDDFTGEIDSSLNETSGNESEDDFAGKIDSSIEVTNGNEFEIKLNTAVVPYEWHYKISGSGIEYVAEQLKPISSDDDIPQVGVMLTVFTFKAKKCGNYKIKFEFLPSSGKTESNVQTKIYEINVVE